MIKLLAVAVHVAGNYVSIKTKQLKKYENMKISMSLPNPLYLLSTLLVTIKHRVIRGSVI